MFFSDRGVLPNLISGAVRERRRRRKRVSRMQRKRGVEAYRTKRKERMTNEEGMRQRETRTMYGTDPRAFGLFLKFIAEPQHNYSFFFLFC